MDKQVQDHENKTESKKIYEFVKVDFLDTERFRKINYGNLELRKSYHKFMAIGMGGAIGVFAFIFISYLLYGFIIGFLGDSDVLGGKKRRILDESQLTPPPPIDEKAPPPPPPPPPVKPPEAPGIGEVEKKKEAPRQKTVAVQEIMEEANKKGAVEGDDTSGLAAAPIVEVPVGGGGEELEDPPDFVAVEKEPDFTVRIEPEYPEEAKRLGIQGKVYVRVLVGKKGKAEKVQILKSSGSKALDNSAKKALKNSTYTPAIQNGQPIRVWLSVPIVFKLQQ